MNIALLLVFLGAIVSVAVFLLIGFAWLYAYLAIYASRVSYLSYFTTNPQIQTYLTLLALAFTETLTFLTQSAQQFVRVVQERVLYRLPLILGVLLLAIGTIAWTEYHDVAIEKTYAAYQAIPVTLLYDLRIAEILNVASVLYSVGTPFLTFGVRLYRFFLRTIPRLLVTRSLPTLQTSIQNALNSLIVLVNAHITTLNSPLGVANAPLQTQPAYKQLLTSIADLLVTIVNEQCSPLTFLAEILFRWIGSDGSAQLLAAANNLTFDFAVRVPTRTILGQNPGTVPGVTASYDYVTNPDFFFDNLKSGWLAIGHIINAEIVVLVIEFVGVVEEQQTGSTGSSGLFVPGSTERIILASPWIDSIFLTLSALVIELPRAFVHGVWAGLLYALDLTIELLNGVFGTNFVAPVSMRCDLREWRALLEAGGTTGLYFKGTDKRIAGTPQAAIDAFEEVLDTIDPSTILGRLVASPLRSVVVLLTGAYNIAMRYVLHTIDSEFRMFSPAIPPRTGPPIVSWTPPTPLPTLTTSGPGPGEVNTIDCSSVAFDAGNLVAFAEHLVDDPEGTLIVVDNYGTTFAQALQELVDLIAPGSNLGQTFEELVLLLLYTGDVVVQSIAYFSVASAGTPAQYGLYLNVRRLERWYLTAEDVGDAVGDNIRALHETLTGSACASSSDGFFCALGNVVEKTVTIARVLIDQTLFVVDKARVLDPELPSYLEAVNEFEEALRSLLELITFVVPALPYNGGNTLRDLVDPFPQPLASLVTLIFRIPNYALVKFRDDVYPDVKAGNLAPVLANLAAWATDVLEFIVGQVILNVKDIISASGQLLDTLFGTTIYGSLANALNRVLDLLELVLDDIVLEILALVLNLVVNTVNLFFGFNSGNSFTDRLEDFVGALEDLLSFFLTEEPLFVVDLFFALIESLLPSPLNVIIASVARALRTGLCAVLQAFIGTVVSVLNFFGAGLDKVDLACGTKKRSRAPYDDEADEQQFKMALHNLSKNAYISDEKLRRKAHKVTEAMRRLGKEPRRQSSSDSFFGGIFETKGLKRAGNDASADGGDGFVTSNVSKFDEEEADGAPVTLTMSEAMQLIADITEWNGTTLCDLLVEEVRARSEDGRDPALSLLERLTYEDCLSKRAIGELIAVIPNMQWFPEDGLYNIFAWLTLAQDGLRAYSIYSHFKQDKHMPKEIVLGEAYKEEWAAKNMRVDHLTEDNYAYMLANMTIRDYFMRNNGNYDLVWSLGNLWGTLRSNAFELGRFLDRVAINDTAQLSTQSLVEDATPLEAWLYKYDVTASSVNLTDAQKRTRKFWRALMTVSKASIAGAAGISKRVLSAFQSDESGYDGVEGNIVSKMWEDGRYAVTWLINGAPEGPEDPLRHPDGTVTERPDPWEQRRKDLERLGFPFASAARPANNGTNQPDGPQSPTQRLGKYIASRIDAARVLIEACNTEHACEQRESAGRLAFELSVLYDNVRSGWRPGMVPHENSLGRKRAYGGNPFGSVQVETGACNLTRVPFCLQCYAVDASVQEIALSVDQFLTYWDGRFQQNVARYTALNTYIASDTINVCGGDSTQEIHFPSSLPVTSASTLFDILGQSDGAINGVIRFIETEVAAFFENSTLLDADANAIASGGNNFEAHSVPDYATIYAQSLTQFDPTYAVTGILPLEGGVLPFIDSLFEKISNIEFSVSLQIDPALGPNDPITLPNITNGGGTGSGTADVFLGIFGIILGTDYTHQDEPKKLEYIQVVGIFAFLGLLFYLAYYAYAQLYPAPMSLGAVLMQLTMMMILPALFLSVVYILPVQNFLMVPLPAPPEQFGADVAEFAFCDVLPKCPAIYAGMVKNGPMTEANCRGTPTQLDFLNCKRDYGVRHALDWFVLLGEFLSPSLMQAIRQYGGSFFSPLLTAAGIDLGRFQSLDFSDRDTFNVYLSCVFVMGPTVPVGALFFDLFWSIFVTVVVTYLLGAVQRILRLAVLAFLVGLEIAKLLIYNYIFVVSPRAMQTLEYRARDVEIQEGYTGPVYPGGRGPAITTNSSTLDIAMEIARGLTPSTNLGEMLRGAHGVSLADAPTEQELSRKDAETSQRKPKDEHSDTPTETRRRTSRRRKRPTDKRNSF